MIEISIGQALVAVEGNSCDKCAIPNMSDVCCGLACHREDREDGKDVVFKLVDWPSAKEGE